MQETVTDRGQRYNGLPGQPWPRLLTCINGANCSKSLCILFCINATSVMLTSAPTGPAAVNSDVVSLMRLLLLLNVFLFAGSTSAAPTFPATAPNSDATKVSWTVEPSAEGGRTTRRLVSFNFDWHPSDEGPTWGKNASVLTIDLQNKRLKNLARAMSPAFLRVGGSEGDDAVYDIDGACSRSRGGSGVPDPAYCMTVPRWKELMGFATDAGLDVAFGLNVMYGRNCTTRCAKQPCPAGNTGYGTCSPWDPSNAIALLNLTASLGYGAGKGLGAFEGV